jgi:cell division protein FtsN
MRPGIVVHPGGSFNLPALANTISHRSPLISRATSTNVGGVVFIVILVLVAVSIIFCAALVFIILKNKRKRRQRQRQIEVTEPAVVHEYRQLEDMDSAHNMPSELPPENQVKDPIPLQRAELQSDVNEVPKIQQLDGSPAPVC